MIKKILDSIELYLLGMYKEKENYPFHLELEKELLFDNYDEIYKEDSNVAELLNDEIPDICTIAEEIGINEFKERLKVELMKDKALYNR